MATFTITTGNQENLPGIVGNYSAYILNRSALTFTPAMFTTATEPAYSNPGGETAKSVVIQTLPASGSLTVNGLAVTAGEEILLSTIELGNLVYSAPALDTSVSVSITFNVLDSAAILSENVGTFSIGVARKRSTVNLPGTVGNNTFNIPHGQTKTFALADFTTATSPVYYDPEGDAVQAIEISDLYINGGLTLSGAVVIIGQDILVADIPNLVYTPDNTVYDENDNIIKFRALDSGSQQYSNEGTIKITVAEKARTAPIVESNSAFLSSGIYQFKAEDVTKNFSDADTDTFRNVKIVSLSPIGKLTYLGVDYVMGTEIRISNIAGLKYHLPINYTIENGILYKFEKAPAQIREEMKAEGYKLVYHQDGIMSFENSSLNQIYIEAQAGGTIAAQFTVSDNSVFNLYSNEATFTLTPQGNFNVESVVNLPPVIGDNTLNSNYSQIETLHRDLFIETDPRFQDPEGDQPYQLKVLTLPQHGHLILRGTPVVVNQVLDFATDIDTGDFKFDPDDNLQYFYEMEFDFTVSDTGSKTFA